MKRATPYLFGFMALMASFWLAGFAAFVEQVKSLPELAIDDSLPPVEAIVALTGGSERITTGLELLAAGKGRKMLVSGVHPGLTMSRIFSSPLATEERRACCIVLGHDAGNTVGNAEETKEWMRREGLRSARLVTSQYHMPRSLLIFHAVLPDIAIVPHPVAAENVKLNAWWTHPGTAGLLLSEYNKYLYAALLARFGLLP